MNKNTHEIECQMGEKTFDLISLSAHKSVFGHAACIVYGFFLTFDSNFNSAVFDQVCCNLIPIKCACFFFWKLIDKSCVISSFSMMFDAFYTHLGLSSLSYSLALTLTLLRSLCLSLSSYIKFRSSQKY